MKSPIWQGAGTFVFQCLLQAISNDEILQFVLREPSLWYLCLRYVGQRGVQGGKICAYENVTSDGWGIELNWAECI